MKCKECGLEYEVTTTTSETGDISLRGIHDAGGVDCLTRQLAAAQSRIAELEEEVQSWAWAFDDEADTNSGPAAGKAQ